MSTSPSVKDGSRFLLVPALLIFVVFFLVPLAWIIVFSFMPSGHEGEAGVSMTLANYEKFLSDSYYLKDLLWRTVRLSALATFFAVTIGYIGAFLITRASEKLQPWLIFLNMCPLWVNLVIRTLSLMVILGRDGPVNHILMALGISERPVQLLYNEIAVLIGMVQVSVPFVVLSVYGVLKSIPRNLEHAAMSVGANPLSAFVRVTLPLSVPGIFAGSILALGINMESFVVPILLGGGRVRFMSVAAYEMATVSNNLPFAATIGVILLIVTLLMLAMYQWLVHSLRRKPAAFGEI